MSLALKLIHANKPLSQWRKYYADTNRGAYDESLKLNFSWSGSKNPAKLAQLIFSQLSHDDAVALVAREFDSFPADLRIQLRTLCNNGNATGNVRKGVQRLDKLMGGKLMRAEVHVEKFQAKTRDGWSSKNVNPAVAGATRKYGIVK